MPDDALYSPADTATALHSNERTLERWRHKGTGPEFVLIGRKVFYTGRSLKAYIKRRTRQRTDPAARAPRTPKAA